MRADGTNRLIRSTIEIIIGIVSAEGEAAVKVGNNVCADKDGHEIVGVPASALDSIPALVTR